MFEGLHIVNNLCFCDSNFVDGPADVDAKMSLVETNLTYVSISKF